MRQDTTTVNIREYSELADETLVSLGEACKRFPIPVSRPTVERLWRYGQRGVRLETIFLIGRRWTSIEAIRRFIERTQSTGEGNPAEPKPTLPKRDLEAGRKKFNLPEAGRNGQPVASASELTD